MTRNQARVVSPTGGLTRPSSGLSQSLPNLLRGDRSPQRWVQAVYWPGGRCLA